MTIFIASGDPEFYLARSGRETPHRACATPLVPTRQPKGVLYSHRSTVLHSFGINLADSIAITAKDVVLPVVPMFHVNAWARPMPARWSAPRW